MITIVDLPSPVLLYSVLNLACDLGVPSQDTPLTAQLEGKTRARIRPMYLASNRVVVTGAGGHRSGFDGMVQTGMEEGVRESNERLAELLARDKAA